MDTDDLDNGNDSVGQVFMTAMWAVWGPLTWPLIIVNVLAYLWCGYQRFSLSVRMKRSAPPLPSGWRTKHGEASMPRKAIFFPHAAIFGLVLIHGGDVACADGPEMMRRNLE